MKIKTWKEIANEEFDDDHILTHADVRYCMAVEINLLRDYFDRLDKPSNEMIQAGVKAFQNARFKESDPLYDWRAFHKAVINFKEATDERRDNPNQ